MRKNPKSAIKKYKNNRSNKHKIVDDPRNTETQEMIHARNGEILGNEMERRKKKS